MSENKNKGENWDTDSMIWNAKSLQRVAKELERHEESPQSDPLLFSGRFLAGPNPLTLATEIALKAWQCQERKGKPDRSHDLMKLFDSLESSTQETLEARTSGCDRYGETGSISSIAETPAITARPNHNIRQEYSRMRGSLNSSAFDLITDASRRIPNETGNDEAYPMVSMR